VPLAGEIVHASDVPPSAWSAYSPAWTASTTNPVLNNGVLFATYYQVGDLVIYKGVLQSGTTTTYGTGTYRISVPVAPDLLFGTLVVHAGVTFLDASTGLAYYGGAKLSNAGYLEVFGVGATYAAAVNQWAATVPVTMAVNDYLAWCVAYQTAA